ncbi:MAG: hypothetical protein MRY83_01485 [Flavobacteriales bacterium]|nr:hypothetical protein [Flavobacteriales bacterium]
MKLAERNIIVSSPHIERDSKKYIFEGGQRFGDEVINFGQFNKAEKDLIQLSNNDEILIESLEVLKSNVADEDKKKKSGGYVKEFLESSVGEAGKTLMKELIEKGSDYIDYIM